jgi:Fic family protein
MIEHIHPFRDGNGRMGRLWQTLVLSKWNPLFEWMPVETVIHNNQARYYEALRRSHGRTATDCAPFVDFMLDAIENSLYNYIDIAAETAAEDDAAIRAEKLGVKLGVKLSVNQAAILKLIMANGRVTVKEIAKRINLSETSVQNNIAKLKKMGALVREGSDKSGQWKVVGDE